MDNRRQKNSSGDNFSFPAHDRESEFEFGCVTPDSPNSPADHLFFNGRLLPHPFPSQLTNTTSPFGCLQKYNNQTGHTSTYSRSTSSKDSLTSSRSNSSNSRSSSCNSARTSTSEASDQRMLLTRSKLVRKSPVANRPVLGPQKYGSSQRWQFITPVPTVLSHQVSHQKRAAKSSGDKAGGNAWFGRRFFRSFVSACKECHAMEPSTKGSSVLQGNMEVQQ